MKRLFLPIVLLALALAGCSSSSTKAYPILGTWEYKMKFGSMMSTFNADGTFRTKTYGLGGQTISGTYKVEGDSLSMNPTQRFSADKRIMESFAKEPLKSSTNHIEFQDANHFTLFEGGSQIKFEKLSGDPSDTAPKTP